MFMLVLRGVHSVAEGFFLHHMRAIARLPLRLLHSLLSSSCLLDVSPQPWVVRFQLIHASILGCLFSIIYLFFSQSVIILF